MPSIASLIVPGLVLVLSTEFSLSSLAALIESLLYDESPVLLWEEGS